MARIIEISLSADRTERLIAEIGSVEGIVGLTLQRGVSLQPQGDVISVQASNQALPDLRRLLDRHGIGHHHGSVVTTEPRSVTAYPGQLHLDRETNEMAWKGKTVCPLLH